MISTRRNKIMEICPEGFEDDLKAFIDDIENEVIEIRDKMDIHGLSQLHELDEAHDKMCDLAASLY